MAATISLGGIQCSHWRRQLLKNILKSCARHHTEPGGGAEGAASL